MVKTSSQSAVAAGAPHNILPHLRPHPKGQAAAEAFCGLAERRETREPLECGDLSPLWHASPAVRARRFGGAARWFSAATRRPGLKMRQSPTYFPNGRKGSFPVGFDVEAVREVFRGIESGEGSPHSKGFAFSWGLTDWRSLGASKTKGEARGGYGRRKCAVDRLRCRRISDKKTFRPCASLWSAAIYRRFGLMPDNHTRLDGQDLKPKRRRGRRTP